MTISETLRERDKVKARTIDDLIPHVRALSVHQPWATFLSAGVKLFETRSWPAADHAGPILIHATKRKVQEADARLWNDYRDACQAHQPLPNDYPLRAPGLPTAAFVGLAWLSDGRMAAEQAGKHLELIVADPNPNWDVDETIRRVEAAERELDLGNFSRSRFAWHFTGAAPLAVQVPAKGRQGIWKPRGNDTRQALKQVDAETLIWMLKDVQGGR